MSDEAMSDEAPVQAFSFRFTNPIQDSGEPLANLLFIEETPTERDLLAVEATPVDRTTIQLLSPSSATPSPTNHHFALTFTLGTLVKPEAIRLSSDAAKDWVMIHRVQEAARATGRARAAGKAGARAIGDDVLYFLYKGSSTITLDPEHALSLLMHTIGGAPAGGSRSTVVRFAWRDDPRLVRVETTRIPPPTNLVEYSGLTVLRRRVATGAPLAIGFVSSDTILNDGAGKSFLQLRIANTGATAIKLAAGNSATPTRFTLRFQAGSTTSAREVLATAAQINAFKLPGTTSHGADTGWSTTAKIDVSHSSQNTSWTLTAKTTRTELAAGEAILVPISNVITGHATGRSAVTLVYEGLPDYEDGELVTFIQKSPLVFSGAKVGIGTVAPGDPLTIVTTGTAAEPKTYGMTQVSGTVKVSTFVHSKKDTASFGSGAIGTQSNHEFYVFANGSDKKHLTVKGDGKIGIGTGSDALSDKVTVLTGTTAYGLTHQSSSTLKLSTYLYASAAGIGTQTSSDFHLFSGGQGNKRVTVKSTGNVGIGTESPGDKLTISTGASNYGLTHISGTMKLSTCVYTASVGFGTQSDHDLHFFTNTRNNTRLSIKKTGLIGVGTESPAEKLHISGGNFRVDGAIKSWGPIDLYPNVDKTANEDLLRVRNMNGSAVFTIKHDGALSFSRKPFEVKIYKATADNQKIDTGFKHSDWVASVAGFNMACHSNIKGLRLIPGSSSYRSNWIVWCDTIGGSDNYVEFTLLFVRRELVHDHGGWGVESTRIGSGDEDHAVPEVPFASRARTTRGPRAQESTRKPKPRRSTPRRKRTPVGA